MDDVLSDEYFKWLVKHDLICSRLYDFNNNYNSNNKNIGKLFDVVDEYAKKNYIVSSTNNEKYFIKYKNYYFEIGIQYGPDIVHYIIKKKFDNKIKYIDIEDIKNNVITINDIYVRMKLINKYIEELNDLNYPLDNIVEETKKTVSLLKRKNNMRNR